MKKYIVFGLCLVLLLGAVQAFGAGLTGKNEITGAAAWMKVSADGDDVTATLFGAGYGRFINENLELKADVLFARASLDGEDLTAWILAPAAVWNFTPKVPAAVVPYVGVGAAFVSVDADGSDSSINFEYFAGAKFFIGGDYETANKNVFVEFRHSNVELWDDSGTINMVWAGISSVF